MPNQCRHGDTYYIAPSAPFRGCAYCKRYESIGAHMRRIYSFLIVVCFYICIGPLIGTISFYVLLGGDFHPLLFMGGYFIGFFPALSAGVSNWLVLYFFYRKGNLRYYWPCVAISWLVSNLFIVYYGIDNGFWLISGVCLSATWVCAHIVNTIAWPMLENS